MSQNQKIGNSVPSTEFSSKDRLSVTVRSHPNIAFIKYFGKSDIEQNLPATSSLGFNLSQFYSTAQVIACKRKTNHDKDVLLFNKVSVQDAPYKKALKVWNKIRTIAGNDLVFHCTSFSNFPVSAGFASSSSAFSAITYASAKAAHLNLTMSELAQISRLGSGSSARCFFQGISYLYKDGTAGMLYPADWMPLESITLTVSSKSKKVSSGEAMKIVQSNTKAFDEWLNRSQIVFKQALISLRARNFEEFARTCHENLNDFHQLLNRCGIDYLGNSGRAMLDYLKQLNGKANPFIITTDAGPNIILFFPLKKSNRFLYAYKNNLKKLTSHIEVHQNACITIS